MNNSMMSRRAWVSVSAVGVLVAAALMVAPAANAVPVNLALSATATASSEYTTYQQTASKVNDGFTDGYPNGDYTHEWATNQQRSGWVQLSWAQPVVLSKVTLFDRPNSQDNVRSGTLSFSSGGSVAVSALSNSGTAKDVAFTARTVSWVRFTVGSVSSATNAVGLAEFQAWGEQVAPPTTATSAPPTTTTTTTPPAGPFTRIFTENFTTPAATWPGTYSTTWDNYDGFCDTACTGWYSDTTLSVHDGALDMNLHTAGGKALVAAPSPILPGQAAWTGQLYGRYTITFRSDPVVGYKTAWLLWPDDGHTCGNGKTGWDCGEIDFPEGNLDSDISGFNHCPGNPTQNCEIVESPTRYADGNWHTAVIEWTPGLIKFILDGTELGREADAAQVPIVPMTWVLQTETAYAVPPASSAGHLYVDSVSIDKYTP